MADGMWALDAQRSGTLLRLGRSHVEAQDLWIAIDLNLPRSDRSTFASIHGVVRPHVPARRIPRCVRDRIGGFLRLASRAVEHGRGHIARGLPARAEGNPGHGVEALA